MAEVALFGNPNTGKTSLFNYLTGSYAVIGNWTGVTVDKKVGRLKGNGDSVVDLPGLYTLVPLSKDEEVATRYLLTDSCSAVVNIVDSSQLMRNLNLTIDLLEYGKPVVLGLNMIDVARHRGLLIRPQILEERLGIPVVPIVARTGRGCKKLEDAIAELRTRTANHFSIDYGQETETAIDELIRMMPEGSEHRRWLAIQYLLGNHVIESAVLRMAGDRSPETVKSRLARLLRRDDERMTVTRMIQSKRKSYISGLVREAVQQKKSVEQTASDRLDLLITNKWIGLPLFLALMYVIFHVTFNWIGNPLSDLLDAFFSGPLTDWTDTLLTRLDVLPFIKDLILNGIIAGVGGVIIFIPQIFVFFLFISWIEDSGYMARAALLMDRLMQGIGLNGKAFIPLVIGFGCNIPAIMATRSIEQPKERLLTVLIAPLMSCSARLTVFILFAGVFFRAYQALVVLSLYVLSIVVAMLMAKFFSLFMKETRSFFVIELPPYRLPNLKTILRATWDKAKGFVRKAFTFILAGTVFIWLLAYTGPAGTDVEIDNSFLALICSAIAPLMAPLGFGSWQASSALISGFLAKESVVSTLGIIYSGSEGLSLVDAIAQSFTPLQAYSFMVFTLFYIPCLSTVPAIRHEVGSRRLTLFVVGYCIVLAYVLSFVIYRFGLLFG